MKPKPKRKVRGGTCWAVLPRGGSPNVIHQTGSSEENAKLWFDITYKLTQHELADDTVVRLIRWREVLPTPRARKGKR